MSSEYGRIERIRADQVRDGDRIKAPEGRAFYRIEKATHRPGLEGPDDDQVELDAGWGSVRLDPDEMVERENWQVGEASAEIEGNMRDRLADLRDLATLANGGELDRHRVEELGVEEFGTAENADTALNEYPLAVEATTVFEVVLGTGGPDDRLLFECTEVRGGTGVHRATEDDRDISYEINRVLYRYSWTGSAERVLSGEDRETAEELARRVVPELVG